MRCVLDNAGRLDRRVSSVSLANRSPVGVVGAEDKPLVAVGVEGGGGLSEEDDG